MAGVDHWTCQEHYDVFLMLGNRFAQLNLIAGILYILCTKVKL